MLASYFIVSGFKAIKNPEPLVSGAEPVADRLVPLIKKVAPDSVSGSVPTDTATLVRINGALQLGGGLALATGKGRRLGAVLLAVSLVPSTVSRHPFWTRDTPEAKAEDRAHFLKNVSLLGGVLIASADTEGKPSLAWRAQAGGDKLAKKGRKAKKALTGNSDSLADSVSKGAKDLGGHTQELAGVALAGGAGLLGTVEKQTRSVRRKAKKKAKNAAKKFSAEAQSRAKEAQALAQKQAKKAAKDAPKLARQAKKVAQERAEEARKAAEKRAKQAKKDAPKLAKQASKDAKSAAKQATRTVKSTAKDTTKDARKTADKVTS